MKMIPMPLAGSAISLTPGHIAPGTVSAKSILDLEGRELAGFRQAHFFAGIGVWSAALRAAGWPDSRRVWTGSCPCQPFSAAGKGAGFADERHLWPAWFWLIEQHRPDVIFGEQVEGPAGRAWLDLVFADLEGVGYACGAVVFPAAGVGAPHLRHRLYWVADAAERATTHRARNARTTREGEGLTRGASLPSTAQLAGWPTPMAGDDRAEGLQLGRATRWACAPDGWALPSWPTPQRSDANLESERRGRSGEKKPASATARATSPRLWQVHAAAAQPG